MRVPSFSSERHKNRVRSNLWTTTEKQIIRETASTFSDCVAFFVLAKKRNYVVSAPFLHEDRPTGRHTYKLGKSHLYSAPEVHIATHIALASQPPNGKRDCSIIESKEPSVWLPPSRIFMSLLCRLVNTCEDCKKESAAEN